MTTSRLYRTGGAACALFITLAIGASHGPPAGGLDVCSMPADPGPCDGACPRWHFDADSLQCAEFTWGCCEGNANNFELRIQCQAHCACALPKDPGPCEGICPRWFYNAKTGECEEFIWGCCDGNANNFETLQECEAACAHPCLGDIDFDGAVDVNDLLAIFMAWGAPFAGVDLNDDGIVDVQDLVIVITAWGACT